jgi:hypothetical protein
MKSTTSLCSSPGRTASRIDAVKAFIDHLSDRTFEEWLRIGRAVEMDRAGASARMIACARVVSAIASLDLALSADDQRALITPFFTAPDSYPAPDRSPARAV